MFVILRTIEPASGYFNKKKQRKILGKCRPVSCSSENGMPFFMLDVLNGKNGLDFQLIEEKCGCYVSRIVAPRSISLPDSSRLKRFTPGISNGLFILNTALETIKKVNPAPNETGITVIDRNAFMCSEIQCLLPYGSPLRVVTSRPERYAAACRKIYDEFGASVVLRPVYEPSSKKDMVICCDGATAESMNNAAVFSFKRGIYGKIRFFGSHITLSEKHREIIPENIEASDFAAALTELCGSTAYKSAVFSDIETNGFVDAKLSPSECLECYIRNI